MNQTTLELLSELSQRTQAVIEDGQTRRLHTALDLIQQGLCYRASTHVGFFIIKFGRVPE
jgi:hypothetical protein